MRNAIVVSVGFATILLFSPTAFSQNPHDPSWKPCPQCVGAEEKTAERAKAANLPFDPHDLSGLWGDNTNRIQLSGKMPALTPLGKQLFEATKTEVTPDGGNISNSKDPMLKCDPFGWPRYFTYNYGFEILHLRDRTLMFFEMWHTWRTIWTDGRSLPKNPDPRFLGYSVGHWEENTFVVESYGFDERTWLNENRATDVPRGTTVEGVPVQGRDHGWPHSDELRTVERWTRTGHNTLDVVLTITDPKIYKGPWVTPGTFLLNPNTELWEDFCSPSEYAVFNESVLRPAAGKLEDKK